MKLLHPLGCLQQLGGCNTRKQCSNLQLHCGIEEFNALSHPWEELSDNSESNNKGITGYLNALSCGVATVLERDSDCSESDDDSMSSPNTNSYEDFREVGLSVPVEVDILTLVTDEDLWKVFLNSSGGEDDESFDDWSKILGGLFLFSATSPSKYFS